MKELIQGESVIPNGTPYPIYQSYVNRYVFASNFVKNKIILDVACGTGYESIFLSRMSKFMFEVDILREVIYYAMVSYKSETHRVYLIRLDAVNLPFPEETFNVIVSFETIEHLREYKKFLSECNRILKKGGLFICSTVNKRIYFPITEKYKTLPCHRVLSR